MGKWSNLTAGEKARIIRFALDNGVSDIKTIRDTYDIYASDSLANSDYDMAAAKAAGFGSNGNGHYPDTFKKPNHPTFSDESIYHSEATPGGRWRGNTYEPSEFVLNQQGGWNNFLRGFYSQEQGTGAVPIFNGGVMLPEVTVTPQYKEGGSIHIKHPGRLTALKERTGKTEAELWAAGNAHTRKMITFARNARKWKHSTGGPLYPFSFSKYPLPQVRYDDGGYLQKGIKSISNLNVPTREQIIADAWANENPTGKGLMANGLWKKYPDPNGKGFNVGPGLLVGTRIADKETYTKQELDEEAYKFGIEGLKAIGDAYNEFYGTKQVPAPWDTVSIAPKRLMLDTRYQNGSLPQSGWPSLYEAVANGDWAEAIKQTRSTFTKDGVTHYDNDRVRRRAETIFPGMFDVSFIKDSKEYPKVTKKKK